VNSQATVWLYSGAAVIILLAYLPLFSAVARASQSNPYAGHVMFVPLFAALLLWRERRRLRALSGQGTLLGAAVIGVALAAAVIADHASSVPFHVLSFVIALAGLGLWCYGRCALRLTAFPLAYLLLMTPPPREAVAAVAPHVQHVIAAFSAVVLDQLRIPFQQHDIFLRLPAITLKVAEECAGLRFSLILFVFMAAFARVVVPSVGGQAVLITAAIPVALLTNAARVAVTSIGAYAIGPEVVIGPVHYYIGKAFWALCLLAMVGLAWTLRATRQAELAGGTRRAHVVAEAP
jgi:exosortase